MAKYIELLCLLLSGISQASCCFFFCNPVITVLPIPFKHLFLCQTFMSVSDRGVMKEKVIQAAVDMQSSES